MSALAGFEIKGNILHKLREGFKKKRPVFVVFDYEGGGGVSGNVKRLRSFFISYAFLECSKMILDPQNML